MKGAPPKKTAMMAAAVTKADGVIASAKTLWELNQAIQAKLSVAGLLMSVGFTFGEREKYREELREFLGEECRE